VETVFKFGSRLTIASPRSRWQTIPEWGEIKFTWSFKFGPNHIYRTADARVVKFCTQIGHIINC